MDQLPTDEVPHWKAEIWTIVHQAVLDPSRKFCQRYQKRTPTEQMRFLERRLHTSEAIYKLLTRLGSDTIEQFHVSKLLRSMQTDVTYSFLLWRLSHHLGEAFRTRSQPHLG